MSTRHLRNSAKTPTPLSCNTISRLQLAGILRVNVSLPVELEPTVESVTNVEVVHRRRRNMAMSAAVSV
jgi:hypothetical protein